MEVGKTSDKTIMEMVVDCQEDGGDETTLPGFRFHPTDEELVGFYLKRKVEKRALSIEIIKQVDIYKYDPWDLSKVSTVGVGDKEWYFFCLRGRKYRNSVRPNRVTGSGFWKATGIDKPIYAGNGANICIGLKKSLVYYRGSAGKGTKTDWMMHEFRLPPKANANGDLEADNWTICRIFKRNVTFKKTPQQPQKPSTPKTFQTPSDHFSPNSCSIESTESSVDHNSFKQELGTPMQEKSELTTSFNQDSNQSSDEHYWNSILLDVDHSDSNFTLSNAFDAFEDANWEELSRILDSAIEIPVVGGCRHV